VSTLIAAVLKTHRLIAVSFTPCYLLDLTDGDIWNLLVLFNSWRLSADQWRAKPKSCLAWLSNKDIKIRQFRLQLCWFLHCVSSHGHIMLCVICGGLKQYLDTWSWSFKYLVLWWFLVDVLKFIQVSY